jgi:hypothetical protein
VIAVLIVLQSWFILGWIFHHRHKIEDDDDSIGSVTSLLLPPPQMSSHTTRNREDHRIPLERIVLLGERHSGTTFFTHHLRDCFSSNHKNTTNIRVGNVLTANKHWLQRNASYIRTVWEQFANETLPVWPTSHGGSYVPSWSEMMTKYTYDLNQNDSNSNSLSLVFQNTLVIVMTRNPYDWTEAMRRIPHHWPNHVDACHAPRIQPLSWKQFIQQPLILHEMKNSHLPEENNGTLCQKGYLPDTISPCTRTEQYRLPKCNNKPLLDGTGQPAFTKFASVNDPVYELREDSKPYSNLLELRTAKLLNLLSIPKMWKVYGFMHVQYEDLVMHGTRAILQNISNLILQNDDNHDDSNSPPPYRCRFLPPMKKKFHSKYKLEPAWKEWIEQHVDWDVEAKVGYYRQ